MLDSSQKRAEYVRLFTKRAVLDIIVSGKGVITYEKINSINILNLKPENGIFF